MHAFFYQTKYSTQQWLGTVRTCPTCLTQKPKDGFRMFEGKLQCPECIKEQLEEKALARS